MNNNATSVIQLAPRSAPIFHSGRLKHGVWIIVPQMDWEFHDEWQLSCHLYITTSKL